MSYSLLDHQVLYDMVSKRDGGPLQRQTPAHIVVLAITIKLRPRQCRGVYAHLAESQRLVLLRTVNVKTDLPILTQRLQMSNHVMHVLLASSLQ